MEDGKNESIEGDEGSRKVKLISNNRINAGECLCREGVDQSRQQVNSEVNKPIA